MASPIITSRRSFLKSTTTVAAAPFLGSLAGLYAKKAMASGPSTLVASPYGAIAPVDDITTGLPLLKLPPGFSYKSYGWTGDAMTSGGTTPSHHDGMAVVRSRRVGRSNEMTLVRNHERGAGSLIAASAQYAGGTITIPPGLATTAFPIATDYPNGRAAGFASGFTGTVGGGTTNLVFRDGNWVGSFPSLGGTAGNCAGGPTPWGTWISCEETVVNFSAWGGRKHGFAFEVTVDGAGMSGQPIVGMGRLVHEACAIDPRTGFVYETEDNRNASGFYRYVPNVVLGAPGTLEQGGRLFGAKVVGVNNADLNVANVGDTYQLEWVEISNPDADPQIRTNFPGFGSTANATGTAAMSGPFALGWDAGCLRMSRGEGIWYWNRKMYIVDTATGLENRASPPPRFGRGDGAVWELDLDTQMLTCIFAVPQNASSVGNNPDNVTVSPKGGILLCEDGGTFSAAGQTFGARMMGLNLDGDAWAFAENNLTPAVVAASVAQGKTANGGSIGIEFAGACFSPDGRVLFVNIQTPGITLAISGPWGAGPL